MPLPKRAQLPKQEIPKMCYTCKHYNLKRGAYCDHYNKPFSEPFAWAEDDTKLPPGLRTCREWKERGGKK